jgi:hypothetical protein
MKNLILSPSLYRNCAYYEKIQEPVETLEGFAIVWRNLLAKKCRFCKKYCDEKSLRCPKTKN